MVQIITDSAADFESYEYEKLNVKCIPLYVSIGGREYKETVELSKDLFYQLLEQDDGFPHTAQPSPQCFAEKITEAQEKGDEIIIITLSSALSGTYQGAQLAKNIAEYDHCYVVDSLTATGGQRLLVEYAVRLRKKGKSAPEIVSAIEEIRSRIVLYACMDTMEYLCRGGRISHTTYTIGSIVHVKPIITVTKEGTVAIPSKAIGIRKGIGFMCGKVDEHPPDDNHPLYVMFTGNRKNAEILRTRLQEMGCEVPDDRIINVGAAIGSHIGPNACGLVYIQKE